jgi:quinol monooxygenase YgiN
VKIGRAQAPLTVAARLRARPEAREEVLRALLSMVEQTGAEAGCVWFDLYESLDDPCSFRLSEGRTSRQALEQHLKRPYVARFLGRCDALLMEPANISL